MNNKAFTLIELLAVVILLSIIVFLVLPNVVGLLKDKETEIDELTFTIIKDATKLYMEDNNELYDKKTGNQYCISLSELVGNEYLKDNIKYDGKDITNLMSIQVNYNGGYNYELVKNNECITNKVICSAVTEKTKTTGNVPQGNYESGDEYICEVRKNVFYHFFVLDEDYNDSSKISMILESNINKNGELVKSDTMDDKGMVNWLNNPDFESTNGKPRDITLSSSRCIEYGLCTDAVQGPITALKYLLQATSNWNNIENIFVNYDNSVLGVYNGIITKDNITKIFNGYEEEVFQYKNLKARLPLVSELEKTGCGYKNEGDPWNTIVAKCPLYMINYTTTSVEINAIEKYKNKVCVSDLHGYWSFFADNNSAKIIRYDGRISYDGIDFGNTMGDTTTSYYETSVYGVRPVISVSKKYINN